jgi:O-antigen/teichoic acid export membrane protein
LWQGVRASPGRSISVISASEPHATAVPAAPEPELLDTPHAGAVAVRGSVLRAGAYTASVLLALVSAPLLIRHLGISEFGRYVAVLSLVTIVSGLTEAGLNAIAMREYATASAERRERLMANLLGVRFALGVAGVVAAVAFAAVAGYGAALVAGTALAGVGMVVVLAQSLLTVPLQVELRLGWVSALELLRQLVVVLLIVALVLAGAGVTPFLATTIPAGLVAFAITAVLVRGRAAPWPAFDVRTWWPLVRDTVPYGMAIALNAMYLRLAIVVMTLVATALETGYFATSFRILEALLGVPALLVGAAFPILVHAVHGDHDRFAAAAGRLFELAVIVGSWMVVCVEIGAPAAVRVIGGADAEPAVPVLRIQGFALLATFVVVACGFPLLAERRYREILLANVVALVASLVLTLALVPVLDAEGAALATVGAEMALAVAVAVLLARSHRGVRLPWGSVPRVLVAAGGAAAAGLAAPLPAVAQGVLATAVYALLLLLVGRFPPELRHALAAPRRARAAS